MNIITKIRILLLKLNFFNIMKSMNYTGNDNLEVLKKAKNYNSFLIKNIENLINKNNFSNIIDFGCADGYFIENILASNKNIKISGVEVDKRTSKICKNKNIKVIKNLDETKELYDLIYSLNVLEHIKNDEEIIENFYKRLNNNGKILIYVPACKFLFSSLDEKTKHYRRYTKKDLKRKIEKYFKIEKIEYVDSLGVIATLLYKFKDIFKNSKGKINKYQVMIYDKIFPFSRLLDRLLLKKILGKNLIVIASKN